VLIYFISSDVLLNGPQKGRLASGSKLFAFHGSCAAVSFLTCRALPIATVRHSRIAFKLKNYKDGKTTSVKSTFHPNNIDV
jgi:hypothetical protein